MTDKPIRNRELLLKTADRIEQFPESYCQWSYRTKSTAAPCGTTACLAGEIVICSQPDVEQRLAGFSDREAYCLFETTLGSIWPQPYALQFQKAVSPAEKAKVAAYLLRYLADGGEV